MEQFVRRSLLFDFYGELLTDHQKRIYQEIVFNDFSPSEVARDEGISRQGVYDLMKRCDRMLNDYEDRLHLVERFVKIRENIAEIQKLTEQSESVSIEERMRKIRGISTDILEEL